MNSSTTTDEILDLIDENDNIIGEINRNKANSCPKYLHREIVIILINGQNKVLIQKRHASKKVMPEFWTESVCGHVPKGIDPLKAAYIEMEEEIGIKTELIFLFKKFVCTWTEKHLSYVFLGIVPANQTIVMEAGQVEQTKFVNKTEFDELMDSGARVHGETYMDLQRLWNGEFDDKITKLSSINP